MAKLNVLKMEAVRGIRDTSLDLKGRSLLVFGENGSGKSSIVDALEWLFRNQMSSLEGAQAVSVARHGHHSGFPREAMKVSVTLLSTQRGPCSGDPLPG